MCKEDNYKNTEVILKYNQDESDEILKSLNGNNKILDDRISKTKNLLKEMDIDLENYKKNLNLDMNLKKKKKVAVVEKTWDEILENIDFRKYENVNISDILTAEEEMVAVDKIKKIDKEFEKATGLNKRDIKFMLFATALQCLRQYTLSNDKFRFETDKQGDKFIKKIVPKSYQEILLSPVPYDAIRKSEEYKDQETGISGRNHRYTTLGHDPVLGWIFGTLNILTNTLSKTQPFVETYRVNQNPVTGNYTEIGERVPIMTIFAEGVVLVQDDYKLLAVALARQAIHLGADAFTKMGLPVPIIATISPELAGKLVGVEFRVDTYSVSRGMMVANFINTIISILHSFFYDEKEDGPRAFYEVRTKKILKYSNLLATSSNVIYTAITKDFTKLDVGGYITTLQRLVSDNIFISKVKDEFINGILDKELEIEIEKIDKFYEELGR